MVAIFISVYYTDSIRIASAAGKIVFEGNYRYTFRMGRRKKKPAEKRTNTLHVKLTNAERAELDDAAKADDMDTSTFVRRIVLEFVRKQKDN